MALSADYRGSDEVTVCVFGDGASNQGTFGETLNLAALWRLPVVFMVTNNQYGMGTALERHSAQTDLHRRGDGFGVPGMRCDGMDVAATYDVMCRAIRRAREDREPVLVEAVTYRFRGHSMADPEEYRSKEQVEEWRRRDPIPTFADRLVRDGALPPDGLEAIDREVRERIDGAVRFADDAAFPPPQALYDHIYVLGDQVKGWYSVDVRAAGVHKGEAERSMDAEERGPEELYHREVERAGREDVGVSKPTDAAQEGDD
jgi:pyruvate dehydrogenase E1 component alpha subunit